MVTRKCAKSTATFAGAVLLLATSAVLGDASIVIKQAPALPPPSGATINVTNISQFYSAISSATSGTTIVIQPGTYYLSSVPQLNRAGVTIRGATGNRDDVVLVGNGINGEGPGGSSYGFQVNRDDITIADLTISGVRYHGIQIRGESDVDRTRIHNVKILNAGERYVKGSTATGIISDDVEVAYCWFEQTQEISGHGDDDYIGGIDAIGIAGWHIHDCYFKNIHGASGGGRGGIFLWGGVTNCISERNVVINCDRGIAYGNPYRASGVSYHSTGGIIRNNFVVRGAGYALELCATNNLKVYNNTLYSSNTGSNAVHLYDGVTTGLQLHYNIIRGQIFWNNAGGTVTGTTTGSIVGSTPQTGWFVEPLVGDMRLTSSATAAINQGVVLAEVTDDYFGLPRDSQPDVGAHEYIAPAGPRITAVTPALATVQNKTAPLQQMTITFDKDVTISASRVAVQGLTTGLHNDFTFAYSSASRIVTLTWAQPLPNDTYVINVSAAVAAGGVALDGECDLYNPVLPTGNGTAGGAFQGLVYRLAGDVDGDRSVNVFDIFRLAECWNSQAADPAYDPAADLDEDGQVNIFDIFVIAENWNASIPVGP